MRADNQEQKFALSERVPEGTVSGVIFSEDKSKVLAVRKYHHDKPGDTGELSVDFGFPGGGVEKGETLGQTVFREVKQEVGISIIVPTGQFMCTKPYVNYHHSFFLFGDYTGEISTTPSYREDELPENSPAEWISVVDIFFKKTKSWVPGQMVPLCLIVLEVWKEKAQQNRDVSYDCAEIQNILIAEQERLDRYRSHA